MPYIRQVDRKKFESAIVELSGEKTSGDANYIITSLLDTWFYLSEAPCYHAINEAIGVLECVKLELYRRVAAPYEDQKILENGDVY